MSEWYRHPTVVFGGAGLVIAVAANAVTEITMNPELTNYAGIVGICGIALTLSAVIMPLFSMRAPVDYDEEQEEESI